VSQGSANRQGCRLTDLSTRFDPRTTLARPDLAAQALEGRIRAETFRATEPMRGSTPVADIHIEADTTSERIDQLLHGEIFDVLDRRGVKRVATEPWAGWTPRRWFLT